MTDKTSDQTPSQDQAAGDAPAPAPAGQNPIFYRKPEPLDVRRHKSLGLEDSSDFRFAAGANAIPVHVGEFALVARDYPIVFVGAENPMPVAIVGIRHNENLFIDSNGGWAAGRYIPAYVRRYPFLFLRNEAQSQLILCFDRESERVAENAKNPFFEGEDPSAFTKKALEFATEIQQQFSATEQFITLLKNLDLLVSQQRSFVLYTGEQRALTDFLTVDETKFNAVDDERFLSLRNSGAIGAVYCHLVSLNSWVGLIHRGNALLKQAEKARNSV